MNPVYESLEIVVTLRCNARCRNCIRLCNRQDLGLDYSGLDITEEQFALVLQQVQELPRAIGQRAFGVLCLTGGEPLLHPRLHRMLDAAISLEHSCVDQVVVNSNRTLPIPLGMEPRVVHWWAVGAEKAAHHVAMLSDPAERGERVTRASCTHYRKNRIVVTSQGWTRCCAAEGYVRLLCREDLILDHLPATTKDWPDMDAVCAHCAFAAPTQIYERDCGAPVSAVFAAAAAQNLAGRAVRKRLA
jgi:hypothetical protein